MNYLKPVDVPCPEGYIPLSQPRSFTNRSGGSDPVIRLSLPKLPEDLTSLLLLITPHISEFDEIRNVCLNALAKIKSNQFIFGLTDKAISIIQSSLKVNDYGRTWSVDLPLKEIFIFQAIPLKSLS